MYITEVMIGKKLYHINASRLQEVIIEFLGHV